MRLLLDECLPRKLKYAFTNHEAQTVADMGWLGVENGALLALAEREFAGLVTVDRKLPYQQQVTAFKLTVVILEARRNRLQDLLPLVPKAEEALSHAQTGEVIVISDGDL